jgi:hypothetical protein
MKKYFTKLQTVFFITLISFAYIFFFEIITRTSLFFITSNKSILFYGINKNISFEVSDLTELEFTIDDINKLNKITIDNKKPELDKNKKSLKTKIVIWTFGASMTYGYSCGEDSSSWPEELSLMDNSFEIVNFAFPSIYSDYSIKILSQNLNKKDIIKPNYILWSHKDEEKISIYTGIQRNKHKIKNKMSYTKNHLSLKIAKTIETNLTSYVILQHMIDRMKKKYNIYPKGFDEDKAVKDEDNLAAIENYAINTQEGIDRAKSKNIEDFIIISLFDKFSLKPDQGKTNQEIKFPEFYYSAVNKLTSKNNIKFIDTVTSLDKDDKDNIDQYFCKNEHFSLLGNQK